MAKIEAEQGTCKTKKEETSSLRLLLSFPKDLAPDMALDGYELIFEIVMSTCLTI